MDYKYKVSAIVPCYNSEQFLAETLDNLLGQTLKEVQIILMNDGSTDSTPQIIADYAAKYPNILALSQENAGVSTARNNALNYVEGKYTIFADSDDLMSIDALEVLYNALERSGADIAICSVEYFGYGGNRPHNEAQAVSRIKNIDVYERRLLWNFLVSNKFYKSSLIQESSVRFPLKRFSEDGAFCMQLFYQGAKIIGVDNAVMYYRKREPSEGYSVTQSINYNLVEDMFDCSDIIEKAAIESFSRPDCTCTDKEGYLQELYRKTYSTFITSFYRLIMSTDEKTIALMKEKYEALNAKLSPESKQMLVNTAKDLGKLCFDKKELLANPFITVVSKNPSEDFCKSLYSQSMPLFELITASDFKGENVVNLPVKGFGRAVRKAARGKIVIRLDGKKPLTDTRIFKVISLLKRHSLFGRLPDFVIKTGAVLFLKIKK